MSTSLRLDTQIWGNVEGADTRIIRSNPMGMAIVPTAQPDLRGGSRMDLLLGVNLLAQHGFFRGHRLALEVGLPLHQNLDGPQLESDWLLTLGWQKAF